MKCSVVALSFMGQCSMKCSVVALASSRQNEIKSVV